MKKDDREKRYKVTRKRRETKERDSRQKKREKKTQTWISICGFPLM